MALMHKQEWWHDILSYWNQPYYIIINLNRVRMHNTLQFHKPHTLWMWYFVLLIRQGSKLFKNAWFWHQNVDLIFLNILIGHLHFSDNQRIFYDFCKIVPFSEISRNKIAAGIFLHPGSLDPQRLTDGARGPRWLAMQAWSAGALPSTTGSQSPARAGRGRSYDARDRGGKSIGITSLHFRRMPLG
jgi:hypothetical protein